MKIVNPAAFVLVCLLARAAAKKDFTPPQHGSGNGTEPIKTAANFDASGVKMTVCPSGDCATGKYMSLSVTSITELDSKGVQVVSVDKIKPKESDWTAITTDEVDGVSVSSTTFVSALTVGSGNVPVGFNLTASIYQGNATVEYGDQNLTVPAGALKFTVDINGWKFANTTNTLTLAVQLDAKGPKGAALGKPEKKSKGDGNSKPDTPVERVEMGESMFMDAPTYAILDGVQTNLVNSSVVVSGSGTSFEWVFSSFTKTLHYDPVLGEDTSTTTTTTSSGSTSESSSGDATKAPSASSASMLSLSGLAAAGLAALALGFF
ncbi:hypothetical protein PHYPSEUDO_000226 [Phytophthora pseudosyringae]|uniref:Uncharacterized protein n=1 Tax=Phytophthora pseudosyringae TaxID=221518 RepID=A0A8T1WJ52_9STRA|nr:hypothetical protein PHYPSEUDO_000226 [Phytophthora pseudosyringae]